MTVQIEVLTGQSYDVDDSSGIVDLIEAINIQGSGPTEASRALRKKLLVYLYNINPRSDSNTSPSKYGNVHRQLRALTILDFLIQNAGDRFLREFADEPLLERLRIAATDPVSDQRVKDKCKQLFRQWAVSYSNRPGMERVAVLYRQLPKRKQPANVAKAKVLRETSSNDPPLGHSVSVSSGSRPATLLSTPKETSKSKKKDKLKALGGVGSRERAFSLDKEKPEVLHTLAAASFASTGLLNALKLVNRENHQVSEDAEVMNRFGTCKELRRKILRYIQHIESEEFLGSLIHANEELVTALMAFEVLDRSLDYDSDSDDDVLKGGRRRLNDADVDRAFAGLAINPPMPPRPPRPTNLSISSSSRPTQGAHDSETESEAESDDDENNPFGDRNAIQTPVVGTSGPTWYA